MSTYSEDDENAPPPCCAPCCPPVSPLTTALSLLLIFGLIYGTAWALLGPSVLPGGDYFALLVLGLIAFLAGRLTRLIKLPMLVGMMIVGFVLRNAPYINVANAIPEHWAGNIRNCALCLILLRAGLEVDSDVLKRRSIACSELIFIPFIVECVSAAVAAHFLFNMAWIWSFLLGFMLSAVSPAVVLPVMIKLQKKGIGSGNGIPTMVIAVAGIDDVLAVTGFEVVLGLIFATGSLAWNIAQGPVQIIIGIIYGILLGVITWYLPNPDEKSRSVLRFLLLCFGGLFVLFVSHAFDWGAAGALGCICFPFVAALRWKRDPNWDPEHNPVGRALSFVWRIIEPFLFGLVGSEIRMEYLDPSTVGLGLATLFIALALRTVACLLAAYAAGFTLKEQIFVTVAGLPKATVQAAIGPVALDHVKKLAMGPEYEQYGIEILTVAVLSILITAPLGATAISLLAPRLLADSGSNLKEKAPVGESKASILDSTSTILTIYNNSNTTKMPSISSDFGEYVAKL